MAHEYKVTTHIKGKQSEVFYGLSEYHALEYIKSLPPTTCWKLEKIKPATARDTNVTYETIADRWN